MRTLIVLTAVLAISGCSHLRKGERIAPPAGRPAPAASGPLQPVPDPGPMLHGPAFPGANAAPDDRRTALADEGGPFFGVALQEPVEMPAVSLTGTLDESPVPSVEPAAPALLPFDLEAPPNAH